MADNEMNNMEEDIIIFEDEEGNEYSYVVVDYMFYNGEEYALLTESDAEEKDDENGQECIICKVVAEEEDGEETESFELVEDETLATRLVDIFNTKIIFSVPRYFLQIFLIKFRLFQPINHSLLFKFPVLKNVQKIYFSFWLNI